MQTLQNFRKSFISTLSTLYPINEAETMFWWSIEEFGQLSKHQSIGMENQILADDLLAKLESVLVELQQHRPIQYVLGKSWFRNFTFEVSESVLIPRPETEELVQIVINQLPHEKARIFEIGTGSGCIAISLDKELKTASITACDISKSALDVARKNAQQLQSSVSFLELDILQPISNFNHLGLFDCIVSNPPYVCQNEKELMRQNVLNYEPHTALFVPNENPLVFYKAIAQFASQHLTSEGIVAVEINEQFGSETAALFLGQGFTSAVVVNDLFEKPRFVLAKK